MQDSAREGAEHTKVEAKSLYASAKDTFSGWLGGKEHAAPEHKDDVDRAVEGTQDAIARNVNKASDTVCIWAIPAHESVHLLAVHEPEALDVRLCSNWKRFAILGALLFWGGSCPPAVNRGLHASTTEWTPELTYTFTIV